MVTVGDRAELWVFAVNERGAVVRNRTRDMVTWTGWTRIGGRVVGAPTVLALGGGGVLVVTRSGTGRYWGRVVQPTRVGRDRQVAAPYRDFTASATILNRLGMLGRNRYAAWSVDGRQPNGRITSMAHVDFDYASTNDYTAPAPPGGMRSSYVTNQDGRDTLLFFRNDSDRLDMVLRVDKPHTGSVDRASRLGLPDKVIASSPGVATADQRNWVCVRNIDASVACTSVTYDPSRAGVGAFEPWRELGGAVV